MDLSGLNIEINPTKMVSSKNKLDIVFVVDNSASMDPVKEGIKRHITTFVKSLEYDKNRKVDFRLGFVLFGHEKFIIKNFTDSVDDFLNAFSSAENYDTGWDEFTLPAVDVAADFDWGERRHKYMIIFTDEGVYGGNNPDFQISKYDELLAKLQELKIKIYYIGTDDEYYKRFLEVGGTNYFVTEDFENVDFSELLAKIGKSVSQSATNLQRSVPNVNKDIYNVRNHIDLITLN